PVEVTEVRRHIDGAAKSAPDHNDVASGGPCRQRDGTYATDVRGEGRERDSPLCRGHNGRDLARHLRLARAAAFAHVIGGVRDESEHPSIAKGPKAIRGRRRADHRSIVELPVAAMNDGAERRAKEKRIGLRDRVRDLEVLDVERTDFEALTRSDDRYRHRLGAR